MAADKGSYVVITPPDPGAPETVMALGVYADLPEDAIGADFGVTVLLDGKVFGHDLRRASRPVRCPGLSDESDPMRSEP